MRIRPCTGSANAKSSDVDRHDVGDLDRLLRRQRRGVERGENRPTRPKWRRKRRVACARDLGRRPLPVLAALDQQRGARIVGVVEERVVAQAPARLVARVDDDVRRQPDARARARAPCAAGRRAPAAGRDRSSSAGRAGSRSRRSTAAAPARARARADCRGPSSTSASHTRLKSSSTQRDANGSAGRTPGRPPTLANTSVSVPRSGPQAAHRAAVDARSRRTPRCRASAPAR